MANKYKDMDELKRRTDTYELRNKEVLKEMLVILQKQRIETDELIEVITHKLDERKEDVPLAKGETVYDI